MNLLNKILFPNSSIRIEFEQERKVRLLNLVILSNILAAILHLIFGMIVQEPLIIIFSCIAIFALSSTYFLTYYNKVNLVSTILVIFACIFIPTFTFFFDDIGLEYYLFSGIIVMSLIYQDKPFTVFIIFCSMIATFVLIQIIHYNLNKTQLNLEYFHFLKYTNISICVFVIYMTMQQYHLDMNKSLKIINQQNRELEVKNQQISSQKLHLEQTNEAKNMILSILAHDLKSPINSLKGSLFLLKKKALTPSDEEKLLQNLYDATSHTSDFLEQLLLWGKGQFENQKSNITEFDLIELVDKIFNLFQNQAITKNIAIEKKYSGEIIQKSDKDLIHTSLRNLMNNSIKFTPTDGKIVLSIEQQKQHVVISISDTGIGISEDNITKIFSKEMMIKEGTMEEKGTGLGLLLVKDCIEKCKGTIQLVKQPEFSTTFNITLPLELHNQS